MLLAVVTGQGEIETVDLPGEQRHALVLGRRPVEGGDAESEEVTGLDELRKDGVAVPRRVRGVVDDGTVVVDEPDETGILHPPAVRRACRGDDPFGDGNLVEHQLVVGRGQPVDEVHRLECGGRRDLGQFERGDAPFEIGERKRLGEALENLPGDQGVGAQFVELCQKQRPVVDRAVAATGHRVGRRGVEFDPAAGPHGSAAELDRGDVALPDGAQAHHEGQTAVRNWFGCGGDHGRVAQGCRLVGVLLDEVGAEQQPPVAAHSGHPFRVRFRLAEALLPDLLEIAVPVGEATPGLLEKIGRVTVGEGQHPLGDGVDPCRRATERRRSGDERLRHHPGRVGSEHEIGACH